MESFDTEIVDKLFKQEKEHAIISPILRIFEENADWLKKHFSNFFWKYQSQTQTYRDRHKKTVPVGIFFENPKSVKFSLKACHPSKSFKTYFEKFRSFTQSTRRLIKMNISITWQNWSKSLFVTTCPKATFLNSLCLQTDQFCSPFFNFPWHSSSGLSQCFSPLPMLNFDIRTQLIYVGPRDTDVNYSNKTKPTKGSRNLEAAGEMFNRINDHYFNFYCINWATRVIINYSYCSCLTKEFFEWNFFCFVFLMVRFSVPRNVFFVCDFYRRNIRDGKVEGR